MKRSLLGLGLGAGLMYFLDPDRGRSRRARTSDRIIHVVNQVHFELESVAHHFLNRSRGLVAAAKSAISGDHASDEVIVARVKSRLGHVISHNRGINVRACDGHVTLSGHIPACEVHRMLLATRSVRGVREVEACLEVVDSPGDHLEPPGDITQPLGGLAPWQENVTPALQVLTGVTVGIAVLRVAWTRPLAGLALAAAGAALVNEPRKHRHRRHARTAQPASRIATGAPVYDVANPIRRATTNELEIDIARQDFDQDRGI